MHNYEKPEIGSKNILIILSSIILTLGYFIFGLIFDYYKFKTLIKTVTFIEMILPFLMVFFDVNNFSYFIIILISCFIFGANIVLFFSEITKIYGILSGTEILSINSIMIGIINLIMFLLKKYSLKDDIHFNIMYVIGGIICIGKFIVLFFLKENIIYTLLNSKHDMRKIVEDSF